MSVAYKLMLLVLPNGGGGHSFWKGDSPLLSAEDSGSRHSPVLSDRKILSSDMVNHQEGYPKGDSGVWRLGFSHPKKSPLLCHRNPSLKRMTMKMSFDPELTCYPSGQTLSSSYVDPVLTWLPHSEPSDTRCVCLVVQHQAILWQQLCVFQFNFILTWCSKREHQIPQVRSSVPQGFLTTCLYHRCQLQMQIVTCASDQLVINWKFSQLLLGFYYLLEWLTELRKKLTYCLPVYCKRILVTAIWEDTEGNVCLLCPHGAGMHVPPGMQMCSPT